jgi:hypothetical protein
LLAGGLVWACEGGEDPLGCAAGGLLCACEGLLDAAGAELEGCVDCVVDFDGWVVVDDGLEFGVLVCGSAAVGELVVELFGDCAKAAVPNTRQTAVVARSCLFILELLSGMDCTRK